MKTIPSLALKTGLPLALFQLGLLLCPTPVPAVTFTLSPAAVSNTYNGVITLQVSGLTNTETVVVQKFLDLNTNGVIDASDWPVQQFRLTDGQAGMVIGGINNSNVPGDTDSTPGQITAKLNFRNGDFMQNTAGQYLFMLSSPGGHFAPITNLFTVTNSPYAQQFTGNVVSNGTSTTVPNAVVLLFPPPRPGKNGPGGNPVAGAVANNAGSYTIPAPSGTYMPVAFSGNYLSDFSTPPVLTLGSGAPLSTNLTLTSATATISGTVVDANNPSKGLPGSFVSLQATNGLMAVGLTDTNGNFTIGVQSSPVQWSLRADDTGLIIRGYLGLQDRTNANAGQTGVTLGVPKGTALFYGSVTDSLGNPMPGIDVYVNDNNNYLYQSDGYTDANGNYAVAALGGLSNDPWQVQISSDSNPTSYIFSQPDFDSNGGTNLGVGQSVLQNFTAVLATNHISGWLKDNSGNPIANVGVWANATINGASYNVGSVDTDTNGNYSLTVANGTWTVGVNTGGGDDKLPGNYLSPDNQSGFNQSVIIANNNGTANFTAILATNHITGHVQQGNGNPIGFVGVWASGTINSVDYFQYVDADAGGNYSLNVANGTWMVGLESSGWGGDNLDAILGSGTYLSSGNQNVSLTNNNGTANFTVLMATNHITGHVQQSNGNPIGYLMVWASATINTVDYFQFVDTDAGGNYSLNVANASWMVGLETTGGGNSLDAILGSGNYQDPGSQNVSINNNNGTANFNVQLQQPLQFITPSLPGGTVGMFYSQSLSASGGQSPYNWWLPGGTFTLPPGVSGDMNFSSNGTNATISGTPATPGTFSFWVGVNDNGSPPNVVTQMFSITIQAAASPLGVATTSLPNATSGAFYSQSLFATGGQPPYHWSLSPFSVNLPLNLVLGTNGLISGVPATNGTFFFSVRVTDSTSATADQPLSITISVIPLQVTTTTLPAATQNISYSTSLVAGGGQPPYRWSLAPGSANLPYYLALGTNGVISGTPAGSGTNYFIVRATDSASATADHLLALVVNASTNKPVVALNRPTRLANGQFQFTFNTAPGVNYTVEVSTDLRTWAPVSVLSGSGGPLTVSYLTATDTKRFYRILIGP